MNLLRKAIVNPLVGTLAILAACHSVYFLTEPTTSFGAFLYLLFAAFVADAVLLLVLVYGRYGDMLMKAMGSEFNQEKEIHPMVFFLSIGSLWVIGTIATAVFPANLVCLAVVGGISLTALAGMIAVPHAN